MNNAEPPYTIYFDRHITSRKSRVLVEVWATTEPADTPASSPRARDSHGPSIAMPFPVPDTLVEISRHRSDRFTYLVMGRGFELEPNGESTEVDQGVAKAILFLRRLII